MKVVAYLRVSTAEQGGDGLGMAAQQTAITSEIQRRGWDLVGTYSDVASGKSAERPGLAAALAAVESGEADGLIVSKLDRLTRSLAHFAALLNRAERRGWNLTAIDLGVDLSTPAGRLVARVMASVAEWERELISDRTRSALREAKARGVKIGRPSLVDPVIVERIDLARQAGGTLQQIASGLNADRVPTSRGGKVWHPSSVRAVLNRASCLAGSGHHLSAGG